MLEPFLMETPTIRTLDEWTTCTEKSDKAVLLQCGSPQCERCPAFTARIEELKSDWQFHHVYVNTHDMEEDLTEVLQVTRLPAYLLVVAGGEVAKGQNATPSDVEVAVATFCKPVFTVDADF